MTLLNEIEVVVGHTGGVCSEMIFPIIIFGAAAILVLIIFILCYDDMDWSDKLFMSCITMGLIAATILFGIEGYKLGGAAITETQYQVMFDDTVSINEIYDKYDVIKQEGKIFTIKEKTADTD